MLPHPNLELIGLDLSSTSWLATSTENNWLLTDDIISIQTTPVVVHIIRKLSTKL